VITVQQRYLHPCIQDAISTPLPPARLRTSTIPYC
jgi:hypothetical protein